MKTLTCHGRRLNDLGQTEGPICGRHINIPAGDLQHARNEGWRVGILPDGTLDALCPRCGAPDRRTRRAALDLVALP